MAAKKNISVVVGMSGGVDSSVTAALLQEQGYDVIGVTMKTYDFDEVGGNIENETSCCGLGAMNDARLVASKLGIPHYVVDFRKEFGREVIDYFVDEYLNGRTPNPCVVCNKEIKWGALIKKAEALGARFLATGHYARVRFDQSLNRFVISQGKFSQKDQSYALWAVSQDALSKTMFPLGELTKPDVRKLAERFGLRTASKQESYEICFVADDNYERFLKERTPRLDVKVDGGDLVWDGKVVGKHRGYPFYTIGQRKGIGAFGQRVYVTDIESHTNTVTIGTDNQLYHQGLVGNQINFPNKDELRHGYRVTAKVRYKDEATPAFVQLEGDDKVRVLFDEPKRAITPGQSVVCYAGEDLLGGAIIERVLP